MTCRIPNGAMVEELRQQQQSCRGTGREVKVVQPLQAVKLCSSLLPPSSYSGYVTPELALKQLRAAYVLALPASTWQTLAAAILLLLAPEQLLLRL